MTDSAEVPDADEELEAAGEPEGEGPGPTSPGSGAEDDANEEEGAPGCGGAAPILAGASTSSGSGLRNTLRKPASDRVTVPAEVPDADAELGSAVDREVEAAPGSGTGSISVINSFNRDALAYKADDTKVEDVSGGTRGK